MKKRHIFVLIGMLLATLCAAALLAACGTAENKPPHKHIWGEYFTVAEATCNEDGSKTRKCTECGAEDTPVAIPATGEHTIVEDKAVEATCTTKGKTAGSHCAVCKTVIVPQTETEMKAHTVVIDEAVEATCTTKGKTAGSHCSVCNTVIVPQTETEMKAHTVVIDEAVEATCTTKGKTAGSHCSVCNTVIVPQTETEIDENAHTPVEVPAVAATCLTEGREAGTECSMCGKAISGLGKIEKTGHSYGEWEHVKVSTCTDQGLDRRTCTQPGCGAVEDKVLDLKEHTIETFGVNRDATCTEVGEKQGERCSVCQHVVKEAETIPALGHEMQEPVHELIDGEHFHTGYCSRCKQPITKEECTFDVVKTEATCTAAEHHVHTCPTCHHTYEHDEGEPLGHNFGDWHFDVEAYDASLRDEDGAATVVRQHRRVCSNPSHTPDPAFPEVENCGKEVDEHVDATCTASGYTNYKCGTCEDAYSGEKQAALGHNWARNEDGTIKYTTIFYEAAQMYVHYMTCTREDCPRPTGTYYACRYETATWEAADCTHGRTMVYTCLDCKHVNRVEKSEPLGHSYGAWQHVDTTSGDASRHYHVCERGDCGHIEEEACVMRSSDQVATCQKPGKEIQVCKDCKYTEEGGEIAMLDHDVAGQPYMTERANARHYQNCKRCGEKVYEACPYALSVTTVLSCTEDEVTNYSCPLCKDSFTRVTEETRGHEVTQYTHSDKFYHRGTCDHCGEEVSVAHDFSESNICAVCRADGLSYAFETGSEGTQARVIRTIKMGAVYVIDTPKIVIPAMVDVDGKGLVPVVGIGTDAFFGNRNITEVELPLSLTYIGYNAFYGCTNLADVHFAGHEAGAHNVADCKLNRIEDGAFKGCVSLTNAILPSTLQYIGREAFRGCTLLSDIEIPEGVTEIEDHAFMDTAYFSNSEHWTGGVLYIGPHLIRAQTSLSGDYEVNAGVISISAEAFMDCKYLEKITLPTTLKAIDRDAFKGCESLGTVVFNGTFEEYLNIRFDNDAASPMHAATTLTIAGAVGDPKIPEGTTVIPAGAFRGSDIEHLVIPASVTSIGANAFADCANLTSVTFEEGSKLITVGADVVKGTKFYAAPENWERGLLYLKDTAGKPVALVAANEEGLEAYVSYEGENFGGSAKQAVIGEGTRAIAPGVFKGFTALRYAEIASTVVTLGERLFDGCTGLARVNFRGTGAGWFCYAPNIGRSYTDAYVYGGENGDDFALQARAAAMFKTYTLQWRRTGK